MESQESQAAAQPSREQPVSRSREEKALSVLVVACRGFAVGAGLHAGMGLLAGITSKKLMQRPLPFLRNLVDGDTVRFASFIALSGSTYKLIMMLLRDKCKKLHGWHAVLAGLAAGAVSIIDDPSRRHTLSLFISARALGALVATLYRRGYLPSIPYFVTVVFGLCQSVILLATTRYPVLMPRSYYRSLLRWSVYYTEEKLEMYFRRPHPHFIPCNALMHEGSCHLCALKDFYNGLFLYAKIYLTIYSMSLVLFRTRNLVEKPKHSLRYVLKNTCTSALFFAIDAMLVKYLLCLLRNAWGKPPPTPAFIPLVSGFVGVVGLLIERQSRRLELLYYVLPQVFYAIWMVLCIKKPLGLHKIPYGSVIVFGLSLMAIMHAFEREKESISPLINTALQLLLSG